MNNEDSSFVFALSPGTTSPDEWRKARPRVARLPTEYRDSVLSFAIGPQPAYNPSTMYYPIRI